MPYYGLKYLRFAVWTVGHVCAPIRGAVADA